MIKPILRIKYYLIYLKNLLTLGFLDFFFNKKSFKQFTSWVNEYKIDSNLKNFSKYLKVRDLNDFVFNSKNIFNIIIDNWSFRQGNLTLYELYCLCVLVKKINSQQIFEIGTFDGLTTLHLALNSSCNTKIHTLDLPQHEINTTKFNLTSGDHHLIQKEGFEIGQYFKYHDVNHKIIQYLSDSAKFDFARFENSVDFVFIDGSHSYEYVKCDSGNALKILKEKGIIVWHDYGNVLDVTKYLNELSSELSIYRIKDTSFAIFTHGT